jgi:hypothetical protein
MLMLPINKTAKLYVINLVHTKLATIRAKVPDALNSALSIKKL